MTLDWAKAFAEVLDVSVSEVLERAGVLDSATEGPVERGFSDGDAAQFVGPEPKLREVMGQAEAFGGGRPGIDVWTVREPSMALHGYQPGDLILVDTHLSERTKAGDVVVAQVYDNTNGSARTVLRRVDPPVLVAAHPDPMQGKAYVIDGVNVVIRGVVMASWRMRA